MSIPWDSQFKTLNLSVKLVRPHNAFRMYVNLRLTDVHTPV
jgi:hypothetical protein